MKYKQVDTLSSTDRILHDALKSVREIFNMQVAFISKFENGYRTFSHVDSQPGFRPIKPGDSNPLEESYCQRVVDGRLPELMTDASLYPEAMNIPETKAIPVGAHISVPIRFREGKIYGTFCCFSSTPDNTLDSKSLEYFRCFSDFVGRVIESVEEDDSEQIKIRIRIEKALDSGFSTYYQPIIDIDNNKAIGYEALTRFSVEPVRTPDKWFAEAAWVGLQKELESAAIKKALEGLNHFNEETYISLNISPGTVLTGCLDEVFKGFPKKRLVLEITEHKNVDDYPKIAAALKSLRDQGMKLAVDDAGAGYASFQHILELKPDIIKLDKSLIHKIESDPSSKSLASALVKFGDETSSIIIAEGVETHGMLEALYSLNINLVQGYLLGHPQPIQDISTNTYEGVHKALKKEIRPGN